LNWARHPWDLSLFSRAWMLEKNRRCGGRWQFIKFSYKWIVIWYMNDYLERHRGVLSIT